MSGGRIVISVALLCLLYGSMASAQEQSVASMKKRADEVLKMGNVEARVYIEDVMRLADRLSKDGNLAEAERYFEAGLKCYPLDLKHQFACAEVQMRMGKKEPALAKAKIVAKLAEEDAQAVPARKMLGEKVDTEVEALGKLDGNVFTIVLTPLDEIDVLLLQEVRAKVQDQLGISVLIRRVPFTMAGFGRDPMHEFAEGLRKNVAKTKQSFPDAFAADLKRAGLKEADLEKDENILAFYRWLASQSKDPAAANRDLANALYNLNSTEKQWDMEKLLPDFKAATQPLWQDKVRFIGVTCHDVYGKGTAFLLANAYLGQVSVISYRRFMSSFTNETVSRERLLKRTVNLALSGCGKVFGVDGCKDPTCPRAYPHSVAEQDAKSDTLCDDCKKAFDKVFGRKPAGS
jgi:predicted Zn-dependent protease